MTNYHHIVILPGNGDADVFRSNWYGWLHKKLNNLESVKCDLRNMPDPLIAKESEWLPFMKNELKVDEHTVIVGHSSGACAAMRFAEKNKVKGIVLVSAYISDLGDKYERESGYFNRPWDWEKIKQNCKWICQFASKDDPFLPWTEQKEVADMLNSELQSYEDRGHFMSFKFPELFDSIKCTIDTIK